MKTILKDVDFNDWWIYRWYSGGLWYKVETYGWLNGYEFVFWMNSGILLEVIKTEYHR